MASTRVLEGDIFVDERLASDDSLAESPPFASGWRLYLLRFGILAVLLVIWELISGNTREGEWALVDKFWMSQPSDILARLVDWISKGTLWFHMAITLQEMATGFVIGSVGGVLIGFLLAQNMVLARIFDPFIIAFYSIPKLALAPLFILWFGIGLEPKIVLVSTVVFLLVFLNTYSGVKDVDQEVIDVFRLMGASQRDLFTKIVLPSASPWILTGLKLAVPYSLIGAVVGEIMASNKGLGYLLMHSQGQFDTAGLFAAIFVLMIMGLLINEVVNRAEEKLLRWKSAGRSGLA
ncbi:MAG TPA: ABC transporter permease [Chloroflexota bacterium]|jgi:NitT/TauT family transport system permease protein|nr:ABC transporter permease [Chloroflexota bacterium]